MLFLICSSALLSDWAFPRVLSSCSLCLRRFVIDLVVSKMLFQRSCSLLSSVSKLTLIRYACMRLSWPKYVFTWFKFLQISSCISTYRGGKFSLPQPRLEELISSSCSLLLPLVGLSSSMEIYSSLPLLVLNLKCYFYSASSSSTFCFFPPFDIFDLSGLNLSRRNCSSLFLRGLVYALRRWSANVANKSRTGPIANDRPSFSDVGVEFIKMV